MNNVRTRDSLAIFWNGEEQDGLSVYGLWLIGDAAPPTFPVEAWPDGTGWKATKLSGDCWTVWLWDVRIEACPPADGWRYTIVTTLNHMRSAGAVVSWCGVEGYFVDPPSLFDPREMSGGIWALLGPDDIIAEPPALDEPFKAISDSLMLEVRKRLGWDRS